VSETAADLAVCLAAISSYNEKAIPANVVVFGEVGLTGEIRPVPYGEERLAEAEKHGFEKAIIPVANVPQNKLGIEVIGVEKLGQVLSILS